MPSNNPCAIRRKGSYNIRDFAAVLTQRTDGRPGLTPYLRDPVPAESENPNMRSVDPLDPPGRFPAPPGPIEVGAADGK